MTTDVDGADMTKQHVRAGPECRDLHGRRYDGPTFAQRFAHRIATRHMPRRPVFRLAPPPRPCHFYRKRRCRRDPGRQSNGRSASGPGVSDRPSRATNMARTCRKVGFKPLPRPRRANLELPGHCHFHAEFPQFAARCGELEIQALAISFRATAPVVRRSEFRKSAAAWISPRCW